MTDPASIQGVCDPAFARVRAAFEENFARRGELGAAVAVMVGGRLVVDLWGGFTEKARTRPWGRDTLVNVYSTTKGLTALCAHLLVDRGLLDVEAPVARYWPEFARAGKDSLPVKYLLSHRAGLPAIGEILSPEAVFDWGAMTGALAGQAPWWEPGTGHGYHALTFGWLVGEVVRRISGRSLGAFFREEVAGPLGLDCHIGLEERHDGRVARLTQMLPGETGETGSAGATFFQTLLEDPQSLPARAFLNPLVPPGTANTRAWRAAEIPAANSHTNARALARLYGALACGGALEGVPLLSPEGIALCSAEQSAGPDRILPVPTRFSLGFMLPVTSAPGGRFSPSTRAFGHPGMGGSLGFADPAAGVGFGYVMNGMGTEVALDPRALALSEALYSCL